MGKNKIVINTTMAGYKKLAKGLGDIVAYLNTEIAAFGKVDKVTQDLWLSKDPLMAAVLGLGEKIVRARKN